AQPGGRAGGAGGDGGAHREPPRPSAEPLERPAGDGADVRAGGAAVGDVRGGGRRSLTPGASPLTDPGRKPGDRGFPPPAVSPAPSSAPPHRGPPAPAACPPRPPCVAR